MGHYSISSLGVFNRCPRQWEYIYKRGMRRPPAGAMVVGSAVHKPQEVHCKRVIGGGDGLGLAEYQETAADEFAARKGEVDWTHEDDDADKCLDRTVRLAAAHHRIIVPTIVAPVAAEEQIDVRFDGADWTLRCILDVVQRADSGVLIRDLKTKGKAPNGVKSGAVEVVRITVEDGGEQLRLPGLDEPPVLNVIDAEEAERLLDDANDKEGRP